MKHSFLKIIIYCSIVLLCGLLRSGGYTYAVESDHDRDNVNELKSTIQQQEETIKQLQAEIEKQQGQIDKLTEKTDPPDPVTQALRESWVGCKSRGVKVKDGLVQVFFINTQDIVVFFDSGAEQNAHYDLATFLKTANLNKGTIEYYNGDKKLFSITGNLTSAKTKKHYSQKPR